MLGTKPIPRQTAPDAPVREGAGLPYRPCVGILLVNREGLVWTGRRLPKWAGDRSAYIWQMPQGGIRRSEMPEQAAFRELREETSVTSVALVGHVPRWLTYELPEALIGVALKGKYRGQRQRWYAMRFLGDDAEINITPAAGKAEFDRWCWRPAAEAVDLAVPFKRDVYQAVMEAFAPLLKA